jgi:hypothetical protein
MPMRKDIAAEGIKPSIIPWMVSFKLITGDKNGRSLSRLLSVAILVMNATLILNHAVC